MGFEITEEDEKVLKSYKVDPEVVEGYLREICESKRLRPFERELPLYLSVLINGAFTLVSFTYFYVCFIILQLALFNLIIMGIMIIVFHRMRTFMTETIFKYEYKYSTKDLKRFVALANETYFRALNVELSASECGTRLIIQLPDNEIAQKKKTTAKDDGRKSRTVTNQVEGASSQGDVSPVLGSR